VVVPEVLAWLVSSVAPMSLLGVRVVGQLVVGGARPRCVPGELKASGVYVVVDVEVVRAK